jgi:hypothetical protein
MTEINVFTSCGIPLVRLSGKVTERSGSELAAAVMSSIHFISGYPAEFPHPITDARRRFTCSLESAISVT